MTTPEETGPELREKIAQIIVQMAAARAAACGIEGGELGLNLHPSEAGARKIADAILAIPPNQGARPEDGPRVDKIAAMIVRGFNLDETDTPDLDIRAAAILAGAIDAAVYQPPRPEDGWLDELEDIHRRSQDENITGLARAIYALEIVKAAPRLIAIARAAGANHDR